MGVTVFSNKFPSHDLFTLHLKAVQIQVLDENHSAVSTATGFIVKQDNAYFLYTCWHTVAGFDLNDIRIPLKPPNRHFLKLNLQKPSNDEVGKIKVSDLQSYILPLHDTSSTPSKPLWHQDIADTAHQDLNTINIRVPRNNDAIRIPLDNALKDNLNISDIQIIEEKFLLDSVIPPIGAKLLIVGYPYGFSTRGISEPTPIALTRFVAAHPFRRGTEALIDSPCSPGMSGSPVFFEYKDKLMLIGIYTGLIYPDHLQEKNEKTTALGTICYLVSTWKHQQFRSNSAS